MQVTISREKAITLITEIRDIVEREIKLSKYFESIFLENNKEKTGIKTDIQGVNNGFLSEILCAIIGYNIEVCREVEQLYPCPCCGLKTLTEVYNPVKGTGYEICHYCNWEDDGTTNTKVYRSINKGSIEDYRKTCKQELINTI